MLQEAQAHGRRRQRDQYPEARQKQRCNHPSHPEAKSHTWEVRVKGAIPRPGAIP